MSLSLCAVCILSWGVTSYIPSKAERYHQHVEEADDATRVCEHTDGSFCTHLPLLCVDTKGATIPGDAYYDEDGNKIITTAPNGDAHITVSLTVTDNTDNNNHLTDAPTQTLLDRKHNRIFRHRIPPGLIRTKTPQTIQMEAQTTVPAPRFPAENRGSGGLRPRKQREF